MTDDTDLSGLDYPSARAYALEFMTALKTAEKALEAARQEVRMWTDRAALAASKGMANLETAARAKAGEAEAKAASLEAEKADLARKIARIREKLPVLKASERSVDADLLLAQLQMVTGEALNPESATLAELDKTIRSGTADAALEELKRKLKGES